MVNLFKDNHFFFVTEFSPAAKCLLLLSLLLLGGGGGGFGQFHIVGYTERLSPKGAPALTAPIKRQLWDIT